jgi:hypothetical protein
MSYAAATSARDKGKMDGKLLSLPMAAVKICKGSLVQISSGYVTSAAPVASQIFAGVAYETVDNSGGSPGDLNIRVETEGIFSFAITDTAAAAHVGLEVYWDDATSSVNVVQADPGIGAKVGRIVEIVSTGEVRVRITGYAMVQANQAS